MTRDNFLCVCVYACVCVQTQSISFLPQNFITSFNTILRSLNVTLQRGQQTLSVKGHILSMLDVVSHVVSVTTIQFYHCSMKTATDYL